MGLFSHFFLCKNPKYKGVKMIYASRRKAE